MTGDRPELDRLLVELRSLRLRPDDWTAIGEHLRTVEHATAGDETSGDRVAVLSQAVFEARVRGRFSGPRTSGDVLPTKQTSVLPWVGLVCGGMLAGTGALLGGGVILAGIVALGIFVFGIAFAGSRVAHRARPDDADAVEPVPIPDDVALLVARLARR